MAGSSPQLTGVDHSSAASSPLVSALGIIDAQASFLYNILFHHLNFFKKKNRSSENRSPVVCIHIIRQLSQRFKQLAK